MDRKNEQNKIEYMYFIYLIQRKIFSVENYLQRAYFLADTHIQVSIHVFPVIKAVACMILRRETE